MAYYQNSGPMGAGQGTTPTNPIAFNQQRVPDQQDILTGQQAGAVHDPLKAAQLAESGKMSRFNSILPLLSGQFSALSQRGGGNAELNANTWNIPGGGQVLNPQQIQQQQNANAASIHQSTATQNQGVQNRVAGAGFGGNSPLAMALTNANNAAATGQIASTNSQLGLNAAQANASQGLNAYTAQNNANAQFNTAKVGQLEAQNRRYGSLYAALGGLI